MRKHIHKYLGTKLFRTNTVKTIVVASVLLGVLFGLVLLEQANTHSATAKHKSDKQKLREENQRLQDKIAAMQNIQGSNVILHNGSSVAFSQLPPETQRAMLNNSALLPQDGGISIGGDIPTIIRGSNNRNDFAFTEFLEVSPNLKGVVMSGPTNRFVDDGGTMHIVGELRNDGIRTVNVFHMVATLYGLNNQTLGLDYANPVPALLSPGQSASFELFVGGESAIDGISDLSQITMVKYHVGS